MNFIGFIPARSGSKRMPDKNIKLLKNKPLIFWTIESFVECKRVSKIIFSSDSEDYIEIVKKKFGDDKLCYHKRTESEAGDKVKIFDYIKNNIQLISNKPDDVLILGLPTAPFRNSIHINECIDLHQKKQKPIFSASEFNFPIKFAFNIKEDLIWETVFEDNPMCNGNTRSQDHVLYYRPNGAIYVRKISDFNNPKLKTLYEDALPYLMNKEFSIDIDDEFDFQIAESIINLNR
tara:strand:+ start:4856 stop:5557 length:702 start_codon:yes stop_codon:yes gene_type:complete